MSRVSFPECTTDTSARSKITLPSGADVRWGYFVIVKDWFFRARYQFLRFSVKENFCGNFIFEGTFFVDRGKGLEKRKNHKNQTQWVVYSNCLTSVVLNLPHATWLLNVSATYSDKCQMCLMQNVQVCLF